MNLVARPWIIAALLGLQILIPANALAGMTPEEVKMFEGIKAKAEKGDARSQVVLGLLFSIGQGVPQDIDQAVSWYRKSAETGDSYAQYCLGDYYATRDAAEAVAWFRKSAEQGNADAQYQLAWRYEAGIRVLEKDLVKAISWYRKSAEQGNAHAQYCLGNCHADGIGVLKDDLEAFSWYRKSAEQGNVDAQSKLGRCYELGLGVTQDIIESYAYWNLVGVTNSDARKELENLEKKMTSEARFRGQQRSKKLQKEIEAKMAMNRAGK